MPKLDKLLLSRWLMDILIGRLNLDLSVRFSDVDCRVMVANLLLLHWSLTWGDIRLNIAILGLSALLT